MLSALITQHNNCHMLGVQMSKHVGTFPSTWKQMEIFIVFSSCLVNLSAAAHFILGVYITIANCTIFHRAPD